MDILDTTFGSFLTTRLEMRLIGTSSDYNSDSISIDSLATYLHEHIHFFQAVFTGYGHIQWDSHRQLTSFILKEWNKFNKLNNVIKLPLANCNMSPEQAFSSHYLYETVKEQIKTNQAKFYMQNGSLTLKEIGLRLLQHSWPANPVVEIGGKHTVIQTKDVLEGHAHFVECNFVEHYCGVDKEKAWDREGLPNQYTNAYDWFIQECGEIKHDYFPIICDLALQISWEPLVPQNENEWQSANPSWRFVKLTRTLASANNISALGGIDSWHLNYKKFCSDLLDLCGYKHLDEILNERLRSFSRKPKLMEIEKIMKKGIELKISKPWIGVNPANDEDELLFLMKEFKTPYIVFEDGIGSFGPSSVSGGELIFELQFQTLAAQVFGDFSKQAIASSKLECAFSKYNIKNSCEFQNSHGCTGLINPKEGFSFPKTTSSGYNLEGCSFELLLNLMNIKVEDIEIDFNAKFPFLKL